MSRACFEADILSSTYEDKMSVYRPSKRIIEGETLFLNGENGDKIYENIPCSLSSISGGKINKGTVFHTTNSDYVVFARPEIIVKENDYIVLVVNVGVREELYHLIAGKSKLFPSHQEILVKEVKKA